MEETLQGPICVFKAKVEVHVFEIHSSSNFDWTKLNQGLFGNAIFWLNYTFLVGSRFCFEAATGDDESWNLHVV